MISAQNVSRECQARFDIQSINSESVCDGSGLTGIRSAGAKAAAAPNVTAAAFKGYWKTGVVGGNAPDRTERDSDK